MSIINMGRAQDVTLGMGAYCPLRWNETPEARKNPVVLWETFEGCCIQDRERNMYDDSDFFMLVWDESQNRAREIMFATTRGWSYPCYGSWTDATPEVMEKYDAWKLEQDYRKDVQRRWDERKALREYARNWGMSVAQAKRVINAYRNSREAIQSIGKLLKTKTFRSEFRKSLANQIRTWANDENPQYARPLSNRQISYLY